MTQVHEIAREVLIEGLDDWVPIDRLIGYAQRNSREYQRVVEEVLQYLFSEGLAEARRIGRDGYAPEGSSQELLEKVFRGLRAVSLVT